MTEYLPREPHEGISADANPETRKIEEDQSPYVARAGESSGMPDYGTSPGDEQPAQAIDGGTTGGDPLAGVTATSDELEDAVPGDTGPTHPGRR